MWSAFMNGSGLHGGGGGGGGAGGGYVQSQGWEFVPCPRTAGAGRGRGESRSPLRRISSPPTVFSQLYEPQFGASPGAGEGGAGTEAEVIRGQMWPSPEPEQQQTNHTRLKKKFEDLKKRHEQDKEGWMREKELLLREVADIQGGENRRILLDLKKVLEEVQVEVKKEEERRGELQLQYTRDRCAWQLEKAELQCRIAQLETREGAGSVGGGVQPAAGPGSEVSQPSETPSRRREREEQRRRLLADTHLSAMDLRCRLEHNERDWLKEKAELLERFDVERREWESQLKDMQRKIEELYCEVRAKREGSAPGGGRQDHKDVVHRLSLRSSSAGSSLSSDHGWGHSEPHRLPPVPGFGHNRSGSGDGGEGTDGRSSTCFQAGGVKAAARFTPRQPEVRDQPTSDVETAEDAAVFDAVFHRAPHTNLLKGNETRVQEPLGYGSDKKKNTTALNAALKEIARVSEELCSYQEEIRKKGDKRNPFESLFSLEKSEMLSGLDNTRLEEDESACDLSQIYYDLRALERENWVTLSPSSTGRSRTARSASRRSSGSDPDTKTNPGFLPDADAAAPPIPPRNSSWNLSSQSHQDAELHIPESPVMGGRRCHSPCVLVDRKCSSPSIVRKFEAMLQENEGKVLVDGAAASCCAPANSHCNTGCCHNRWSCDTSKLSSSKLPGYGTVQKSFSEVNIRSAGKDASSEHNSGGDLQMPVSLREFPVDLLPSSPEVPPTNPCLRGSRRNLMLEQKTAEFNRTLFQAEMGRGVREPDSFTVTDSSSAGYQPVLSASDEHYPPREGKFQPSFSNVTLSITDVHPEAAGPDSSIHEIQKRGTRCGPEGQEVGIKHESPFEPSANQNPAHQPEVGTNSPSRKTQHRAATEDHFSEPVLPINAQPGQNVEGSSSKNENPQRAKPDRARAGASPQHPSAENKQRQMTQSKHAQGDASRPGPRMMNDHPWKPLTLAAYPRPEGSRSNYGALERILKNYESAARAQQNRVQRNETTSSPGPSGWREESTTELDMLDVDSLTSFPNLRPTQPSSNSSMAVKGTQLLVQEKSSASSSPVKKNFSRPARPANRRLPSRWAGRSPTSSSSPPSSTPAAPPPVPLQKHASPFCYSHAFHMETVII